MRTQRSAADVTIDPMIARPAAALPAGREWIYEARVQGLRVLLYKDGPTISIRARGEPELESRHPEVSLAASAIRQERAVLDGILVCEPRATPLFYAMDLVLLNDRDLRAAPLSERREKLPIPDCGRFRYSTARSWKRYGPLRKSVCPACRQTRRLGLSQRRRASCISPKTPATERLAPPRFRPEGAKGLEAFVPAMKHTGRLQFGADADIVLFDPATVREKATYPMRPGRELDALVESCLA